MGRRNGSTVTIEFLSGRDGRHERLVQRPPTLPGPALSVLTGVLSLRLDAEAARSEGVRAYAQFREAKFFGSLDGLRGLSVLGVVWYHTAADDYPDSVLLSSGNLGVTLFFAISGFLITTLLLREQERTGHIDLKAFYARRSLRIFPLYYSVLALYTLLVLALERQSEAGRLFLSNLPYFATYTSNLFVGEGDRVIFYFAWSLALEEQFYLVWPFLLAYVRRSLALGIIGILLVMAVCHWEELILPGTFGPAYDFVAGHLSASLLLGVLVAYALHSPVGFTLLHRVLGSPWAAPVALGLTLWSLASPTAPLTLVHLCFALLVAVCVIRPDHGLTRLLEYRPLGVIGVLSYGIYLLHMLCDNGVRRGLEAVGVESGLARFALTAPLAVGVALLSRRYLEERFLRLKTKFAR